MKTRATFARVLLITATLFIASVLSCTTQKNYYPTAPAIDLRPPVVTWIAPVGGSTIQGVVDLRLIVEDESGIDSLRVFVDGTARTGSALLSRADSLYQLQWDSRADTDGVHSFEARAYDKAGNSGSSPALSIRVQNSPRPPADDHLPPQVAWISPLGSSEVSGTIALALTAWDAGGVDSVRLYKNGATSATYFLTGHPDTLYTHLWDTRNDSDGVYALEVRTWDKAGNQGSCPALVVRVHNNPTPPPEDHLAPRVEWRLPEGGATLHGHVTVSLKAVDKVGVAGVWVYKNGYAPVEWRLPGTADSLYSLLWNTESDTDGAYSLQVQAWDAAGNVGNSPVLNATIINRPPDRTPPVVNWISPLGGAVIQGATVLLVQASDDRQVDSVWVFKNGESPANLHLSTQPSGIYEFAWDTRSDSDGVVVLEARAWDGSRNTGYAPTLAVRVQNHAQQGGDVTPPVVTWLSPDPGSVVRDTVSLRFNATDASGIDSAKVYVDGIEAVIIAGVVDGQYETDWNSWTEPNGRHVLEVRAWDEAGNVGIGEPVGQTIDNHRVFWVPDEFNTIQSAIEASFDGDTVMVRAGIYQEQLQFFDKNVSLISESGPDETTIDLTGFYATSIDGGQDTTMTIRGFTFLNQSDVQSYCISLGAGASPKVMNNIFSLPGVPLGFGLIAGGSRAQIRNNIFIDLYGSGDIASSWGDFTNNMIINATYGIRNAQNRGQPMIPDFNLFWNVETPNRRFPQWGDHNITDHQPIFMEGSHRLTPESPGVDQGRSDVLDVNGTTSDIGAYGGPYAY